MSNAKNFWLVTASVTFINDGMDEPQITTQNAVVTGEANLFNTIMIMKAQAAAQQGLVNELQRNEIPVENLRMFRVIIENVFYAGYMTDEEFHEQPKAEDFLAQAQAVN